MPDNTVEMLFSLFTSSSRAVAMAGDLAEERAQHGWVWFWLHVVGVTFALWRSAAIGAPLRLLALVVAGMAFLAAAAFGGVAAVFLFPWMGSPEGWIALAFFWWGGAFWTGATLVALAPGRGMVASAMLALGGEALLIGFGVRAVLSDTSNTELALFWTTGLIAVMPLLTGAVFARRRFIPSQERHR